METGLVELVAVQTVTLCPKEPVLLPSIPCTKQRQESGYLTECSHLMHQTAKGEYQQNSVAGLLGHFDHFFRGRQSTDICIVAMLLIPKMPEAYKLYPVLKVAKQR